MESSGQPQSSSFNAELLTQKALFVLKYNLLSRVINKKCSHDSENELEKLSVLCGGLTRMAEQAITRHDADLERDILAYESHLDQAVNWYSFIRHQFNVVQ